MPTLNEAPGPQLPRTLEVDIGAGAIKAKVLDARGKSLTARGRLDAPKAATPRQVIAIIKLLATELGDFERVAVAFPGVTRDGVIHTAPTLGPGWAWFPLASKLSRSLGRPVRVAHEVDVQCLGCVQGRGIELVITLDAGVGSVLFVEGHRVHLELGQHLFRKGKTYAQELGTRGMEKHGKRRWNKRLAAAITELSKTFGYDQLILGGANTLHIDLELPESVSTVRTQHARLGGIGLWKEPGRSPVKRPTSRRSLPRAPPSPPPPARVSAPRPAAALDPGS